ncbi:MAG: DUF393 domain-containing protein [Planctomycetota bacterium]
MTRPATMLYDDACPLCTFQMRSLTWLDWRHRIVWRPLSDPGAESLVPGVERSDLRAAIHCVTAEGDVHRGARAIRYVSMRVPLLWPLGLLLWAPGVIWVAEWVYRFVSRHRHRLSKLFGCEGACALLPERPRSDGSESSAKT